MKTRIFNWMKPKRKRPSRPPELPVLPPAADLPEAPAERRGGARRNLIVLGNCQARMLAACMQAQSGEVACKGVELPLATLAAFAERFAKRDPALHSTLAGYDGILVQPLFAPMIEENFPDLAGKTQRFPMLNFSAYHPDLVYVEVAGTKSYLHGPLGHYNSAIAFWGFAHGLSVTDTTSLFNGRTFEALGYFEFWQTSRRALLDEGALAGFALDHHLEKWSRAGCFMHSINHPVLSAVADVAADLLRRSNLSVIPGAATYLADECAEGPVWPVYPEIGERLGLEGHYHFKIERGYCPPDRPVMMLNLRDFVAASFEEFARHPTGSLTCERMAFERFRNFDAAAAGRQSTGSHLRQARETAKTDGRSTPYTGLPAHQFWKRAMSGTAPEDVDPVVSGRFRLSKDSMIATAGSCFAQHLSATLRDNGFNHYISEAGDHLPVDEARYRNYGVYSARFGNVYTAAQLVQLLERAYGGFVPTDSAWRRTDGRYVDPFRPQIEPDGFDSPQAVTVSRNLHLQCVRQMFENLDCFIFTLGLTEAWRSSVDGAVFPLAPGVAGAETDVSDVEFVNFRVQEVVSDLDRFLSRLRDINPRARTILTVSPVPLIATYERQHVLAANTHSKSVLRAAAAEICGRHESCAYFPSYEIITGNHARGAYYESDLRTITAAGVNHVMRLFLKHYFNEKTAESFDPALLKELHKINEIVCDEEAIERG